MQLFRDIKASKTVLIAGGVLLALIVLFASLSIYTYAHSTIFPGVRAGQISLSGKTEEEAASLLDEACAEMYSDAEVKVTIESFDSFTVSAEELGLSLKSAEIAKNAMAVGHDGGFFKRISDVFATIFGGVNVGLSVDMDEVAREELSEEIAKFDIEPVDAAYVIEDDVLVLHPRSDGKKVNLELAVDTILHAFADEKYDDLSFERELAVSVALDMDKVYSEVHAEVKDAYLEKEEGGNRIVPHVLGIDFDLEAAKEAYNKTPDEIVKIPLTITEPKVYTKHLEVNLFKYCLSEVETHFSPKKVSRTSNVRLAAKLIDGTILNPGEEFSYNKTVGPRTAARGFKEAAVFASGEVVDGIGGGICQVSSTLYMAALRANMKIVERKNHSFYVDYTPKGEDATVVYGSIDFRFKNTSAYPIKIVATSKDNYIRIKLMGTEPDEKVTVKLTKKTHSTTPYTTREKKSTTLAAGQREVSQKGQQGLSMSVYRNVYDSKGNLIESYLENNSKYKPMPEIVLVGTGASTPTVAPENPVAPPDSAGPETPAVEPEVTTPTEAPTEAPTETPIPPVEAEKAPEEAPEEVVTENTEGPENTQPETSEPPAEDEAPDWIAE